MGWGSMLAGRAIAGRQLKKHRRILDENARARQSRPKKKPRQLSPAEVKRLEDMEKYTRLHKTPASERRLEMEAELKETEAALEKTKAAIKELKHHIHQEKRATVGLEKKDELSDGAAVAMLLAIGLFVFAFFTDVPGIFIGLSFFIAVIAAGIDDAYQRKKMPKLEGSDSPEQDELKSTTNKGA